MVRTQDQNTDKERRRIVTKAFRRVLKMISEQPHPIVISDADGENSDSTISEITAWLFHRRQDNDNESDPNSN